MRMKLTTLIVAALGLMFASCSDEESGEGVDANAVKVVFTMAMDDATVASRAQGNNEWWNEYDPSDSGNDYENTVNINDLQVFVCDANGKIIEKIGDLYVVKQSKGVYTVTGTWEQAGDKLALAKKVMVLANCVTSVSTDNQVTALTFTPASAAEYIPMWGVASVSSLQTGTQNDLGDIWLLRSLAKTDVTLATATADKGFTIKSAEIVNYNTTGYSVPKTYESVDDTKKVEFDNSLNAYASPASPANHALTLNSTSTATLVQYLPEYDNKTNATKSVINITLERKGIEYGPYTLNFMNYQDGVAVEDSYYDIQRNHYYQFEVSKDDDKTEIVLKVRKWNKRTHDTIYM